MLIGFGTFFLFCAKGRNESRLIYRTVSMFDGAFFPLARISFLKLRVSGAATRAGPGNSFDARLRFLIEAKRGESSACEC